mgnify:CR=1 FL=1
MNRLLIIISAFIVFTSCGESESSDTVKQPDKLVETFIEKESIIADQKKELKEEALCIDCKDFDFKSAKQQADSLIVFMEKATNSSSTDREKWEQRFFCAFPKSFAGMQAVFGYDNDKGAAPLCSTENPTHSYINKRIFSDVIGFFSDLQSIPDSAYYNKYIKINIDGYWEADNISEAFGFHYRLINDTKVACETLENFTDEEIRSVFRFIFDGPHPKNEHNEEILQTLKPEIGEQNQRLGNLLFKAYATMMAEDDGHGH